jgi:hypothetical protein
MEESILKIRNKGVQILLNRMQSHPEEFTSPGRNMGTGRWEWVIDGVIARVEGLLKNTTAMTYDAPRVPFSFLTDEEVGALYDKYMSIRGDAFTHRIMRELLDEEDDLLPRVSVSHSTTGRFGA